jgi:hypothetical protein
LRVADVVQDKARWLKPTFSLFEKRISAIAHAHGLSTYTHHHHQAKVSTKYGPPSTATPGNEIFVFLPTTSDSTNEHRTINIRDQSYHPSTSTIINTIYSQREFCQKFYFKIFRLSF